MNNPFNKRVSGREKEYFAEQLGLMLDSGLSLPRAIDVIYRQTRNEYFKKILANVSHSIQKGRQLSLAMSH